MRRSSPRHLMRAAVFALCVSTLVTTSARATRRLTPLPDAPIVDAAAFRGQGALAVVWADRLLLLDGDNRTLASVSRPGIITAMAWSADGRWLAYSAASSAAASYLGGSLWIVRRDGREAHRVAGLPPTAGAFSWSPTADTLAVGTGPGAPRAMSLWLAGPAERAHRLSAGMAGAWSPDGTVLAYAATRPFTSPQGRSDALYTVPVAGDVARGRYVSKDNGISVVGWWPDGKGLVFFVDPLHSASLAADGLDLYSLALDPRIGAPRLLTMALPHMAWLAPSPSGHDLLLVAGAGREVWTGKALAVCNVRAAACRTLDQPPRVVSLDPTWSASGARIAYVRARDEGSIGGFGSSRGLLAWVGTRTLWVADANGGGARRLTAAGTGIYDPQWSRDGSHVLYLRDDALWLIPTGGADPTRIVGPFPGPFDLTGYYGYVSWAGVFAWSRP